MTYALFLDDERLPPRSWKGRVYWIARSHNDFANRLWLSGCPEEISFDHDLGEDKTGLDCAKYLVNWLLDGNGQLPPSFTFDVHSMNPVGAANIRAYMTGALAAIREARTGDARAMT